MKVSYLLILFLITNLCKGQTDDGTGVRLCIDIKAGAGNGIVSATNFNFENNRTGTHGSVNYPAIYLNTRDQNRASPFINLVFVTRFNPYFELHTGASYIQNIYKVTYNDKYYENFASGSLVSTRYETFAKGTIKNNNYSVGTAFAYRIFNTKIIFGILNITSASNKMSLSGVKSQYQVTRKAYLPPDSYPKDSIVVLMSEEKVQPAREVRSQIYLPISIGIEQEIPIKKLRYLVGVKCVFSKRAYSPLLVFGYIGVRLSKPYSWHKEK